MHVPSKAPAAARAHSSSAATGGLRPRVLVPRGGAVAPAGSAAARVCTRALWRGGTPASFRAVVAALEGKENPLEASFRTSSHQLTAFSALIDELPLCAADECCDDLSVLPLCSTLSRSLKHAAAALSSSAAARGATGGAGAAPTVAVLQKDHEVTKTAATGVCAAHARGGKVGAALRRGGGGGRGELVARVAARGGRDTVASDEGAQADRGIDCNEDTRHCGGAAETAAECSWNQRAAAVAARQGDGEAETREGSATAAKGRETAAAQEGLVEGPMKEGHRVENERAVREAGNDGGGPGNGAAACLGAGVATAASGAKSTTGALYGAPLSDGFGRSAPRVLAERYYKHGRSPSREKLLKLQVHKENAGVAAAAAAEPSSQTGPAAPSACVVDTCSGRHTLDKAVQQQQSAQHLPERYDQQSLCLEQYQQLLRQQQYLQKQQESVQHQQPLVHDQGPDRQGSSPPTCGENRATTHSFRSTFSPSPVDGSTCAAGHGLFGSAFPASFPAFDALPYYKGGDCSVAAALPYNNFNTVVAAAPPCSSSTAAAGAVTCLAAGGSAAALPPSGCTFDTFMAPNYKGYATPALAWGVPFAAAAAADGGAAFVTAVDGFASAAAAAAAAADAAGASSSAALQPWEEEGTRVSANFLFSSPQGLPEGGYVQPTSLRRDPLQQQPKKQPQQYGCTGQRFSPSRHRDSSAAPGTAPEWLRAEAAVEEPAPSSGETRSRTTFSPEPVAATDSSLQSFQASVSDAACGVSPYSNTAAADSAAPTHKVACDSQAQVPLRQGEDHIESTYCDTEGTPANAEAFSTPDIPHTFLCASESAAPAHRSCCSSDALQQPAYSSGEGCPRRSSGCRSADGAYGGSNSFADTIDCCNSSSNESSVRLHGDSLGRDTVCLSPSCCSSNSSGIAGLKTCCISSDSVTVCFCRGDCNRNSGSTCCCSSNSGEGRNSSTDSSSPDVESAAGRRTAAHFLEKGVRHDEPAQERRGSSTFAESSGSSSGRSCFPFVRLADHQGPESAVGAPAAQVLPKGAGQEASASAPVANDWPAAYAYCSTPHASVDVKVHGIATKTTKYMLLRDTSVSCPNLISRHSYITPSCNAPRAAADAACSSAASPSEHHIAAGDTAEAAADSVSADAVPAADAAVPSGATSCVAAAASSAISESDVLFLDAAAAAESEAEARRAGGGSEGHPDFRAASLRAESCSPKGGHGTHMQHRLLQKQRRSYSTCSSSGESSSPAHPWNRSSYSSSFTDDEGERVQQRAQEARIEPQEAPRTAAAEAAEEEGKSAVAGVPAEAQKDVAGAASDMETVSPSSCLPDTNSSSARKLGAGEFLPPRVRGNAGTAGVQTAAEEHWQQKELLLRQEHSVKEGVPAKLHQDARQREGPERLRDADYEGRAERATVVAAGRVGGEAAIGAAAPIAVELETMAASGPENLLLCFKAASSKERHAFYVNRLDLLLLAAAQLPQLRKPRQGQKQPKEGLLPQQQDDKTSRAGEIVEGPAAAAGGAKRQQPLSTAKPVRTTELNFIVSSNNSSSTPGKGNDFPCSAPQLSSDSCSDRSNVASAEAQALTSSLLKKPRTEGTFAAVAAEKSEAGADAAEHDVASAGDRGAARNTKEADKASTEGEKGAPAAAQTEEAGVGASHPGLKAGRMTAVPRATAAGGADAKDAVAVAGRAGDSKKGATEEAGVDGCCPCDGPSEAAVQEGFSERDSQQQQGQCRSSTTTTSRSPVACDDDVENRRSGEGKETKSDLKLQERSSGQCDGHTAEGGVGRTGEESGKENREKERLGGKVEQGVGSTERKEAFLMEQFAQEEVLQALLEELLQREEALKEKERHLLGLQQQLQQQQLQRGDSTRREAAALEAYNWQTRQAGKKGEAAAADDASTATNECWRRGLAADSVQLQPKRKRTSCCSAQETGDSKGQQSLTERLQQPAQQDAQEQPHLTAPSLAGRGVLQKEFLERKARYLAQLEGLRPLLHATTFKDIKAALTDCRTLRQLSVWVGGFEAGDGGSAEAAVARLLQVAAYACGWASTHSKSAFNGTAATVTPYMCVWPSATAPASGSFSTAASPSAAGRGDDQGYFPVLLDSSAAAAAAASSAANVAATPFHVAAGSPYWSAAGVGAFPAPAAVDDQRRRAARQEQGPVATAAAAEGLLSCSALLQMNADAPCAWFGRLSSLPVSGVGDSSTGALHDHLLYSTASPNSNSAPLLYPYYGVATVAQPTAPTAAGERATPAVALGLGTDAALAAVSGKSNFAATAPADATLVAALVADPSWQGATGVISSFATVPAAERDRRAKAPGTGDGDQRTAAGRVNPDRCQERSQRHEKAGVCVTHSVGENRMPTPSPRSSITFSSQSLPGVGDESAARFPTAAISSNTFTAGNDETRQQNEGPRSSAGLDWWTYNPQKASSSRSPVRASRYQAAALLGCCTNQGMQNASANASASSFAAGDVAGDLAPHMPAAAICWLEEGYAGASGGGAGCRSPACAPSAEGMRRLSSEIAERGGYFRCCCCRSINSSCEKCRSKELGCRKDKEATCSRAVLHTELPQEQQHWKQRIQQQLLTGPQQQAQEQQGHAAVQYEQRPHGEEQLETPHKLQGPYVDEVPTHQQETMTRRWQQSVTQQQQRQQLLAWQQHPDTMQQRRRTRPLTQLVGQRTPTRQPEPEEQDESQLGDMLSRKKHAKEVHHGDADERPKRRDASQNGDSTGADLQHGIDTTEAKEKKISVLQKGDPNSTEAPPREEGWTAEQEVEAVPLYMSWSSDEGRDLLQRDTYVHSPKTEKQQQRPHSPARAAPAIENGWKKRRCSSIAPGRERSSAGSPRPVAANPQEHPGQRWQPHEHRQLLCGPVLRSEDEATTEATATAAVGREGATVVLEDTVDERETGQRCRTTLKASSCLPSPYFSRSSSCSSLRAWSCRSRLPFLPGRSSSPGTAARASPDLSLPAAAAPPTSSHSSATRSVATCHRGDVCTPSESVSATRLHGTHWQQQEHLNPSVLQASVHKGVINSGGTQIVEQEKHIDRPTTFSFDFSCSLDAVCAEEHRLNKRSSRTVVPLAAVSGDGVYSVPIPDFSTPSSPSCPTVELQAPAGSTSHRFLARQGRDQAAAAAPPSPVADSSDIPIQSQYREPTSAAGRSTRSRYLTHCTSRAPTPGPSQSPSPSTTVGRAAPRGTSDSIFLPVIAARQQSFPTAGHGFSTAAAPTVAGRRLRNANREAAAGEREPGTHPRSSSVRPLLLVSEKERPAQTSSQVGEIGRAARLRCFSGSSSSRNTTSCARNRLPSCSNGSSNGDGSSSSDWTSCYVGCMAQIPVEHTVAGNILAAGEKGKESDASRCADAASTRMLSSTSKEQNPSSKAAGTTACTSTSAANARVRPEQREYKSCLQKSKRVLRDNFEGGGLQLTRSLSNSTCIDEINCRSDTELINSTADWGDVLDSLCGGDAAAAADAAEAARCPSPECVAEALQVWDELNEALSTGTRSSCTSSKERSRVDASLTAACDAIQGPGIRRRLGASAADESSEADECMRWNTERLRRAPLSANQVRTRAVVPKLWNRLENSPILTLQREARQQRWLSPSTTAGTRAAADKNAASIAAEKGAAVAERAATAANRRDFSVPGRGAATDRLAAADRFTAAEGAAVAGRAAHLVGRSVAAAAAEQLCLDKEDDTDTAYRYREQIEAAYVCSPRAAEEEYQRRLTRLLWEYRSISRSSSLRSIGCNRFQSTVQSRVASIAAGEVDVAVSNPFLLSFGGGRELDCLDAVEAISLQPGGLEKVVFDFQFT